MTQEQQQLLMSVHAKLIKLRDIGQVTDNVHIRDLSNDAIIDLLCLRNDLTSEKEGEYYLSDDENQAFYHEEEKKKIYNHLNENECN